MVLKVLNRLIGRTDSSSVWAVNAYVEGSASDAEIKLVEEMMRRDPALEKNLSTQQGLRDVLSRIERVEAPQSFAVTPEMVAAAERSESGLSRLAELFAPQRRLAMAPAIVAVIAAVGVALLTIGDITGTVDQSGSGGDDSFTAAVAAESAMSSGGGSSADSAPSMEMEIVTESASDASSASGFAGAGAVAATAVPAMAASAVEPEQASPTATVAQEAAPLAPQESTTVTEIEADTAVTEPPSIAAPAPLAKSAAEDTEASSAENAATELELTRSSGSSDSDVSTDDLVEFGVGGGISEDAITNSGIGDGVLERAADGAPEDAASGAGNGISLPLWQLQIALAALAVSAIGAWAGLRRVRGE